MVHTRNNQHIANTACPPPSPLGSGFGFSFGHGVMPLREPPSLAVRGRRSAPSRILGPMPLNQLLKHSM